MKFLSLLIFIFYFYDKIWCFSKKDFDEGVPWPNGIVFYQLSRDFNETSRAIVLGAMKEIEEKSCILFKKKRVNQIIDFVEIQMIPYEGCFSYIGHQRRKKGQLLNLDPFLCLHHGRIMHELMHALSFFHEHQRPDRDDYINIFWENIKPDKYSEFEIKPFTVGQNVNNPYDFESIMHYPNTSSFAAIDPDQPIILPKVEYEGPNINMGQRDHLSELDVKMLNYLYRCKIKRKPKIVKIES